MKRIAVPLVAAILVFPCLPVAAQAPTSGIQIPRPGTPTGAPAPGMPPPRDNRGAAQSGTASLRGRVVGAQTGMPLRRAQVTVVAPESQMRRVATTDGEGRYEFRELPAGRFSVSAIKAGYVSLQYGQRRPFEAGTPVTVADGEMVERIDFSLPTGSVITVRVTDDFGEPVAGAQVQVQRFQYGPDGQRRLTTAGGPGFFPSATDDRGEFRYQLDLQLAYYKSRRSGHRNSAERTLSISAGSVLVAAIASGAAGVLGARAAKLGAALGSLAVFGAALQAFAASRESINQDRRNAERYDNTAQALQGLRERGYDVRLRIAAGSPSVLGEYVAAVQDQGLLEHRQWLEGAENMHAAVARLEKVLEQRSLQKDTASSEEGAPRKDS